MLPHFFFHASAFLFSCFHISLFMLLHFSFHASAFLFSCFCISFFMLLHFSFLYMWDICQNVKPERQSFVSKKTDTYSMYKSKTINFVKLTILLYKGNLEKFGQRRPSFFFLNLKTSIQKNAHALPFLYIDLNFCCKIAKNISKRIKPPVHVVNRLVVWTSGYILWTAITFFEQKMTVWL